MKNIYKFLDDNNIQYHTETFGNNYFYNVIPASFTGILVTLDRDTFKHLQQLVRICEKNGYNLHVFQSKNGETSFSIIEEKEWKILNLYIKYTEKSLKDCDLEIHKYYLSICQKETHASLNDRLRNIMDFYGEGLYIELKAI